MAAPQRNITDRAKRYRAQNNVTGPRKCVLCGSTKDLGVMHLTGNEDHGEPANLAYGCRSCNGLLASAFKTVGAGRPTNQYNPAKAGVPTFEQYMWAVSNHSRGAHDAGGAIIHATPKHKRIEYARRIVTKAQQTKRDRLDDRWNPGVTSYHVYQFQDGSFHIAPITNRATGTPRELEGPYDTRKQAEAALKKYFSRSNPWPFSRPDARKTTPASGGIAYHMAKAGKRAPAAKAKKAAKSAGAYTMPDEAALQAGFKRGLSLSDMLQRANPASGSGPYVVVHEGSSSGARYSYVVKRFKSEAAAQKFTDKKNDEGRGGFYQVKANPGKRNPAQASAEAFEEFHGYGPTEVVTVQKKVHHHKHLASAGVLVGLGVKPISGRPVRQITGLGDDCFLAFNEAKNQLFVEGGDQRMAPSELKKFGVRDEHEIQTLGKLVSVGYFTNKTHLGKEGGEAVYSHTFRATNNNGKHVIVKIARYPDLIYRVLDEQFELSGGSYEILREGINK